jgi:hypothetical protein
VLLSTIFLRLSGKTTRPGNSDFRWKTDWMLTESSTSIYLIFFFQALGSRVPGRQRSVSSAHTPVLLVPEKSREYDCAKKATPVIFYFSRRNQVNSC